MSKQSCQSDDEEMERVSEDLKEGMRRRARSTFAQLSLSMPILIAFRIDPKKLLIEEMKKFIKGDEDVIGKNKG